MISKRFITFCLSIFTASFTFAANHESARDALSSLLGGAFALGTILLCAAFYLIWYFIVAIMARKRNRNVALWILFSLLGTPWLMMLILFCIGKDEPSNRRYND